MKSQEQIRLLRWQLQAREPIHRFSDMKAGDHLVRKGSFLGSSYEHHFICIGSDYHRWPKIVHYYNTAANASRQMIRTGGFSAGSANEQLGIVQEMTLPHKDFIKNEDELQAEGNEVERVVWPEELQRYFVREVIRRALKCREGETFFDLKNNNCESFVMWCLCGLNVSLQVTPLRKALVDIGSGVVRSIWQSLQQAFKVGAELIDDFGAAIGSRVTSSAVGQTGSKVLSTVGVGIGAAVTVIIEAIMAGKDIRKAYKKWQGGILIKSREEFIKEVTDIVLLALLRSGGSVIGMIVGQLVIPIPVVGGLVGAVLGVFGGHLLGKYMSEKCTKILAQKIDSKIVPILEKVYGVMKSADIFPSPQGSSHHGSNVRCTTELRDVISSVTYHIK